MKFKYLLKKNIVKYQELLNYQELLLLLWIFLSVLILLFQFRNAGIHDVGVYIDTGKAVLSQNNPYLIGSRWGTFGPVVIAILSSVFPADIRANIFQLLSFAGIYFFYRTLFPMLEKTEKYLIFMVVIWLSPIRELLSTNQATGIVMGIMAIGIKLSNSTTLSRFISGLFFAIALDLKPHLFGVFFIVWIVINKRKITFLSTLAYLLATHLLIDFSQRRILELDWYKTIGKLSHDASESKLGDSLSFWPILNNYLHAESILFFASMALTLITTVICVYLGLKNKLLDSYLLSFIVPSLSIYFHFYDIIPLCIIFAICIIKSRNSIVTISFLAFLLIPIEYLSIRNNILVFLIVGIVLYFKTRTNSQAEKIKIFCFGGISIFLTLCIHLFNTKLHLSDHLLQSLMVTECICFISITYILSRKQFQSFPQFSI